MVTCNTPLRERRGGWKRGRMVTKGRSGECKLGVDVNRWGGGGGGRKGKSSPDSLRNVKIGGGGKDFYFSIPTSKIDLVCIGGGKEQGGKRGKKKGGGLNNLHLTCSNSGRGGKGDGQKK